MADSLKLYVPAPMAKASVYSVDTEASGSEKEYANDFNPDTYWKRSSGANTFIINTNEATPTVDSVILFFKNYKDIASGSNFDIDYGTGTSPSSNPSTYSLTTYDITTPFRILEFNEISSSDQYWGINLPDQDIHVSMILVCKTYEIDIANEFPENDGYMSNHRILSTQGGREHIILGSRMIPEFFTRSWKGLTSSQLAELTGAFEGAKGNAYPVILQEGSSQSNARLVRFDGKSIDKNQTAYGFYNPTVKFKGIPYIDSGETY